MAGLIIIAGKVGYPIQEDDVSCEILVRPRFLWNTEFHARLKKRMEIKRAIDERINQWLHDAHSQPYLKNAVQFVLKLWFSSWEKSSRMHSRVY